MATNKNAILRYNTLDKCFSNFGRKYYFQDLLDAVNVALLDFNPKLNGVRTRQLRDDIRFMKSEAGYSAPIVVLKDGGSAYYQYEEKDFSIHNSPLTKTEAEQLNNALSILNRFEGAPQFEWISEIGPLIRSQLSIELSDRKVMSYESNIDYSGYENIQPIFNSIVNKRVLNIKYKPFNKNEYELKFHPHYLKEYNNRWFAFGLNEKLNIQKWNLALDRITNIAECKDMYIDTEIEWEDHFYDIIGVTTPQDRKVEKIELIFSQEEANYIKTKPIHPSQKSKVLESGELKVELNLIPNYELETKILFYGDKVRVAKPIWLKSHIINRLNNAITNYK